MKTTMAPLITGLELGNPMWSGFFSSKKHFREKCFKRAEILTQVVKTLFIYKNPTKKSKKKFIGWRLDQSMFTWDQ